MKVWDLMQVHTARVSTLKPSYDKCWSSVQYGGLRLSRMSENGKRCGTLGGLAKVILLVSLFHWLDFYIQPKLELH